jgi:hypothetical protein
MATPRIVFIASFAITVLIRFFLRAASGKPIFQFGKDWRAAVAPRESI